MSFYDHYWPGYNSSKEELQDHSVDVKAIPLAMQELETAMRAAQQSAPYRAQIKQEFQAFMDTTEYVSYSTFLDTFRTHMAALFDNLQGAPYAIVTTERTVDKSHVWMINLFLESLQHLKGKPYPPTKILYVLGGKDDKKKQDLELADIHHVVIVDDVIYSGLQMATYLARTFTAIPSLETEPKHLHVLLAYCTQPARDKLKAVLRGRYAPFTVYGTRFLTLGEKSSTSSLCDDMEDRDEHKVQAFLNKSNIVFQHKLADFVSSFPDIYRGHACYLHEKTKQKTFVPLKQPLLHNCDPKEKQCFPAFYKTPNWQLQLKESQKVYDRDTFISRTQQAFVAHASTRKRPRND